MRPSFQHDMMKYDEFYIYTMQLCNALVLLVQQARFLLKAALLSILLSGLQHVLADSDEEGPTEWQIWKSRYGISYDELVRQPPHLKSSQQQ